MGNSHQFQDRDVRDPRRRLRRLYAGGLRRPGRSAQILLDTAGVRIPGATRHSDRGRRPRRARSHGVARQSPSRVRRVHMNRRPPVSIFKSDNIHYVKFIDVDGCRHRSKKPLSPMAPSRKSAMRPGLERCSSRRSSALPQILSGARTGRRGFPRTCVRLRFSADRSFASAAAARLTCIAYATYSLCRGDFRRPGNNIRARPRRPIRAAKRPELAERSR
jgi:hypothetical protein